jgi:CheY-like chemotaxis protein
MLSQKAKVLLVEDDDLVRQLLARLLTDGSLRKSRQANPD